MPLSHFINDNCKNRIKPSLLRDVKTEALLMFSRTALEGYFSQIDEAGYKPSVGTADETSYVYNTLNALLSKLQECVVNVDYVMTLVEEAKNYPQLRNLAKYEEPLINYYDVMAQTVAHYYADKKAYLPEFLVICVLADWIVEEEKSIKLYPFLGDIDFLELISKFESSRKYFEQIDKCTISEIHELSYKIIEKLKAKKYKVNKNRVSKTRKK